MTPRRTTSRQSTPFLRRRRNKQITLVSVVVVGVAVCVFAAAWVTRWDSLTITKVEVYGAPAELAPQIQTQATDLLAGAYLGLFSRSNVLLYPKDSIIAHLSGFSSNVQGADVHIQDRHTLVVSVTEKAPAAVACSGLPDFDGEELAQTPTGTCYFVDREGLVFATAPSFSGGVYRRYYSDDNIAVGDHFIPDMFDTLQSFYEAVRAADIDAQAILIKADHEYELYVRDARDPDAPHTTIVYFNTTRSITEQRDNFVAFWSHMIKEDRTKKDLTFFDSIDIRFGSNVFYRIAAP